MFALVGTVPDQDFPLVAGEVTLKGDCICIDGKSISVNRGTPALMAAAVKTAEAIGGSLPFGYLAGDIGLGDGSRRLYEYLAGNLAESDFHTIAFHYLQPDVDWHNRVLFAVEEMKQRPFLIADAGFMYAAKMSGQSTEYDLFTPDVGELAFLADEEAPHPFYTRGFILQEENRVPEMITRAYIYENSARHLLVKGEQDYVVSRQEILATVNTPSIDTMEAIGGTGDTLTGIVSALIGSGMEVPRACELAARINRLAGYYAEPTPATQVIEIIKYIPSSLKEIFEKRGETFGQS
ncbi:MAG: sugar kinase [Deltaproteobacteria bacterium]|nr:sugar kinase [Deltaproteobacteria bacterium]